MGQFACNFFGRQRVKLSCFFTFFTSLSMAELLQSFKILANTRKKTNQTLEKWFSGTKKSKFRDIKKNFFMFWRGCATTQIKFFLC